MSKREPPETIPISYLNALEYCPRRFYYEFVEGNMLVNDFVLEGTLLHERIDEPGKHTTEDGAYQVNRLYLYSEKLRLSGFADIIEEQNGVFIPVEYKHGRQGRWLNDHIQLCAQALCLEELLAGPSNETGYHSDMGSLNREEREPDKPLIPYGYIFYFGSRKRVQVYFTPELRAKVYAAIDLAFGIALLDTPPPPLDGKIAVRCRDCSLAPICLPDEVKLLMGRKEGSLANTLSN
jgi:CRISPR-associated exonuclease Cas4